MKNQVFNKLVVACNNRYSIKENRAKEILISFALLLYDGNIDNPPIPFIYSPSSIPPLHS
jgi:hypothetical protein